MNTNSIQLLAGFASSTLFIGSNFPMLFKAFRTKDMSSYSLGNLALRNLGNAVYWLYVVTLPIGPVWYLQAFFTLVSLVMLVFYLHYEKKWIRI